MACARSLLLLSFIAHMSCYITSASNLTNTFHEQFEKWVAEHGKNYACDTERQHRLEVFADNVNFIENFNRGKEFGYTLSINHFADLTSEEFVMMQRGVSGSRPSPSSRPLRPSSTNRLNQTSVPPSVDWRSRGAVTYIRDQGKCGSCWAFAAVAATEGIVRIKTGELIPLSEQELVDCVTASYGCDGGWSDKAFEFIISNSGIASEAEYPYRKVQGKCRAKKLERYDIATIKDYGTVPRKNESMLMAAVAQQPVVVYIDSHSRHFQFYSGDGIYDGPCGVDLDHAVTLVGYGEREGNKYWIAKNSWGESWGDAGYMYLAKDVRKKAGMCGLAMHAYYPIL